KPHVLEHVPMINVHFSLLPRWRGAAPVERAILAGDTETGVCIMQLEEGLDTGPVYACERLPISDDETADELREHMVEVGVGLLLDVLERGLGSPTPQEGEPTYAAKLEHDDHRLDWSQPARQLHRVVRLGRAWTTFRGRRVLVRDARMLDGGFEPGEIEGEVVGAGDGALELIEVQPEGRGPTPARAWVNGARIQPGERFD
ncbi:MAG: methionyl-tRNA formyltransferase, partial [Actinomycetota bacterium]|nr:methionyl-tRNA formyltransferase [Actinomycetota bacterium]